MLKKWWITAILIPLISSGWFPEFFAFTAKNITQNTPEKTVESYYNNLNKKNFKNAYNLYTDHLKNKRPFNKFMNTAYSWNHGNLQSNNEFYTSGKFSVRQILIQAVNNDNEQQVWGGQVFLEREFFDWKIYDIKLSKKKKPKKLSPINRTN